MAGTQSITGLISGLDTSSLISQLMQIESAPQTALKAKQTTTQNIVSALQSLNTKVASLGTAATTAATASSWLALAATSSDASVTAAATSTGQPTSLTFRVDRTAQAQTSLLSAASAGGMLSGQGGSMTVVGADGGMHPVTVASGASPQTLADAINGSGAGITAVAIQVGSGYQLQLTSQSSGAAGAFQVYAGTVTKDADGTVDTSGAAALSLTTVRGAQDAQVTLWPGVAGSDGQPMTMTSSSNTFTNTVAGLSFTVSQPTTADVTVSTSRDDAALTKLGSDLVGQLNLVLGEITSRTTATTSTASDGTTSLSAGVLGGESDVMFLANAVSDAGSGAVTYNGQLVSPSSVGIVIGKDGTFTFDQDAFAAALAADPVKTQTVVAAVAQRVSAVATTYSDPIDGLLTSNITQQQSAVTELGDEISNWDVRLQLRQQALEQQYATMETTLAKLQAQSSYLSSALGSLSTSSTSSSTKSS
jgi:flagellar hook-associated protein 2